MRRSRRAHCVASRDGGAALSVGADGARDRRARCGGASLDGEPRVHRLEPAPGERRRPRSSRRVARRSGAKDCTADRAEARWLGAAALRALVEDWRPTLRWRKQDSNFESRPERTGRSEPRYLDSRPLGQPSRPIPAEHRTLMLIAADRIAGAHILAADADRPVINPAG